MAQDTLSPSSTERSLAGGTVELVSLRKEFTESVAVDGIDLRIPGGEFFSLLGPSGCGKTTTLRMIAGFEEPTSGRIMLDGTDVAHVPAHRRPVNTVFQSYALFPHLSVADNVGYGLRWSSPDDTRTARPDRRERRRLVDEALELVRLGHLAGRRPHQLSGGQQQRVALARALILRPSVLLLDEPLGALDARLRKVLRAELMDVQRTVGTTFVFVTHDQEEALEMSDRLAVMDGGRVVQCGTPREVYEHPRTEFAADFLGTANLLDVDCAGEPGDALRRVQVGAFELVADCPSALPAGPARAVVRPERLRVRRTGSSAPASNTLPGIVDRTVYVGATTQLTVRLPHGPCLQVLALSDEGELPSGTPVEIDCPPGALRVLDREPPAEAGE
ncbi:ABC transporter ATP-binding protein [Streptomyces sp. NPDC051940]|uniref:ABC transporter ATP-binding protein n=1 Tax=Streptomyces sp. NPDC051940 TaxID=3155675 RepID=UPI0034222EE4